MSKKEKYNFTDEQITFVKNVKKINKINTVQGDKVQAIIRTQIDANFNMCIGCKGSVAKNFNRLVLLIEASIGCKIEEFGNKNIPDPAPTKAKKPAAIKVTAKKPAAKKPAAKKK